MTTPAPPDGSDAREADLLNHYFDAFGRGDKRLPADLDSGLAEVARRLRASDSNIPDLSQSDQDRLWLTLMQMRPRPELHALPRTGSPVTLPPSTSSPAQPRDSTPRTNRRAPNRFKYVAGRTIGVVATFALVAMVTLASLAIYQNNKPGDSPPTMIPGVALAPTMQPATTVVSTPGNSSFTGPMPADLQRPVNQGCTLNPWTVEDVLTQIAIPMNGSESPSDWLAALPSPLLAVQGSDNGQWGPYTTGLPAGASPDQSTIDAITYSYGRYVGCSETFTGTSLPATAMFSQDGLIRRFWQGDQGPNGFMIAALGREQQTVSPDVYDQKGAPANVWLWGFRTLEDGRVAAYIAVSNGTSGIVAGPPADNYPVTFNEFQDGLLTNGYIVFVKQGNDWVIDEEKGPMQG